MTDNNQFGPPSFLAEVTAWALTIVTGIAGFIGALVFSNTKKLYALGETVKSLEEQIKLYRSTELMYRVDMIRRLERLEGVPYRMGPPPESEGED